MSQDFFFQCRQGIKLLYSKAFLSTGIATAVFTTRQGGVSSGLHSSLNLGFGCGDAPENVIDNRKRLADALGVSLNSFVFGQQVHGTNVREVRQEHAGNGALSHATAFPETDGFITQSCGVVLAVMCADCVPICFLDLKSGAIGIAHAGWRGTVRGIAKAVVDAMHRSFRTQPSDCLVAIGPSIGPCCYEVGEEVVENFIKANLQESVSCSSGQWRLNLWQANQLILEACGVPASQIHVARLCVSCNPAEFFSHRRDSKNGRLAGRMLGLVWRVLNGQRS